MHSNVDHPDIKTLAVSPVFAMMERWSRPRTEEYEATLYVKPTRETNGWPVPAFTRFAHKRTTMGAVFVDYRDGVSALFTEKGLVVFHTCHDDLFESWVTDADTSGFGTPPNPGFGTPPNPG